MTAMIITYPWPDSRLSPNGRINHRARARLTKQVRNAAAEITFQRGLDPVNVAIPVSVTFHAPSGRWDDDNVKAIGKATMDGIAEAMALDDRDFHHELIVGTPVKGGAIVVMFQPVALNADSIPAS